MILQYQPNRKKKLVVVYANGKKIGAIHQIGTRHQFQGNGNKPDSLGNTYTLEDCKMQLQVAHEE